MHPEYWAILLCFLTWGSLIWSTFLDHRQFTVFTTGMSAMGEMAMPGMTSPQRASWLEAVGDSGLHWMVMICAMMLPALGTSLRLVAKRSLWRRRNRAMALVFTGYALPWVFLGSAVEATVHNIPASLGSAIAIVSLLAAAGWQLTPVKRKSLVGCHLEPLIAPSGWRADWGCVRYGTRLAGRCGMSCWALMIVCIVGHHTILILAFISAIIWTERGSPDRRFLGATALSLFAGVLYLSAKVALPLGRAF
jgi:hypothetical protein